MGLPDLYPAQVGSPYTTLAAPYTSGEGTMTLVDATKLPTAPNIVCLAGDVAGEFSYTGKEGNVLQGVTALPGTPAATTWPAGTFAFRGISAYDLNAIHENMVRTATYVVAASDAPEHVKRQADYVCDGTADNVEIQAAIDALTAGRTSQEEILLIGGVFNIAVTIEVPSHTGLHIRGTVKAIDALDSTLLTNAAAVGVPAYTDPGARDEDISLYGDGVIDGNKYNQTILSDAVSTLNFCGVNNLQIRDLSVLRGYTSAIHTEFIDGVSITNMTIDDSADDGIAINCETHHAVVVGNRVSNSGQGGKSYGAPSGIEVQDGAKYVSVTGNVVSGTADIGIRIATHDAVAASSCADIAIVGNTLHTTGGSGIAVAGTATFPFERIIVADNIVTDAASVGVSGTYVINGVFSQNLISAPGSSGMYLSGCDAIMIAGNGVRLATGKGVRIANSQLCTIQGNTILENTGEGISIGTGTAGFVIANNRATDNTIGIGLDGASHLCHGNICTDTGGATQTKGISVLGTATGCVVVDNLVSGNTSAQIFNAAGASTELRSNPGYITENSGAAASTADGGTIAHGCAAAPTIATVSGSVAGEIVTVTSIDATNITVAIKAADGSAGTSQTIYWRAEV